MVHTQIVLEKCKKLWCKLKFNNIVNKCNKEIVMRAINFYRVVAVGLVYGTLFWLEKWPKNGKSMIFRIIK